MEEERQGRKRAEGGVALVGMDLHSEKGELCLTRWVHGSDSVKVASITTTVAALEGTYRRQIPEGSLTVMEATTNSFAVARRLRAAARRSCPAAACTAPTRSTSRATWS